MDNISYKVANGKLYKQSKELNLEFLYETQEDVYFCLEKDDITYYLSESLITGKITVSDEHSNVYPGDRMLNLLKLKIWI